jgi:hypothetical protein
LPLITDNPAHPTAFRWCSVAAEKFIRNLALDRATMNVNGGAIARPSDRRDRLDPDWHAAR